MIVLHKTITIMKIKSFISFVFFVLMVASCAKDKSVVMPNNANTNNIEIFDIYGQVHNELLQYASDNFIETKAATTREEGIEYILKFQQRGVDLLNVSDKYKNVIKDGLEFYKELYLTDNIYEMISDKTVPSTKSSDEDEITTSEIRQLIRNAYIANEIDLFEYNSFNELIDYVVANAQGTIGNAEFENKVNSLIASWEVKYADVDFSTLQQMPDEREPVDNFTPVNNLEPLPSGALSGTVLNVSKSSIAYWNTESGLVETKAVPAFVGADIAGAIIGACTTSIRQLATTGELDGVGILWGVGTGAITGSTGIVGKLGKWINSLL